MIKKLSELEVVDGCFLKVNDFVQQYELTVIVALKEAERDSDLFEVIADADSFIQHNEWALSIMKMLSASSIKSDGEPKAKRAHHHPTSSTLSSSSALSKYKFDHQNNQAATELNALSANDFYKINQYMMNLGNVRSMNNTS